MVSSRWLRSADPSAGLEYDSGQARYGPGQRDIADRQWDSWRFSQEPDHGQSDALSRLGHDVIRKEGYLLVVP